MSHYMVVETTILSNQKHSIQENAKESFEQKYSRFIQNGGVIGMPIMKDASRLYPKQMRRRYPRDKSYLEDPEVQITYIQKRTKIDLTSEQKALYYNLRWIPSKFHQVIIRQESNKLGKVIEYKHPSQLDEIGILSQVFKFTGDTYREDLLRKYCQIFRSHESFEIDL